MRPIVNGRKTRLVYAGAGAIMLAVPATAVALAAGPLSSPTTTAHAASSSGASADGIKRNSLRIRRELAARVAAKRGCHKLFTVKMGERAAHVIYAGTGRVTKHEFKVLGNIERCQLNPAAHRFVRDYDRRQGRGHAARIAAAHAAAVAQAQAAQQQVASSSQQSSTSSASGSSSSSQQSGGWAIPGSVVQCESGGQNQSPNGSGASGYYQIIPSTWQAYGGGKYAPSAYQASPQQQAAIASKIWNGGSGAGQWDCAG